jgi:hypothetical protein
MDILDWTTTRKHPHVIILAIQNPRNLDFRISRVKLLLRL